MSSSFDHAIYKFILELLKAKHNTLHNLPQANRMPFAEARAHQILQGYQVATSFEVKTGMDHLRSCFRNVLPANAK